jgi:hypothetical protein
MNLYVYPPPGPVHPINMLYSLFYTPTSQIPIIFHLKHHPLGLSQEYVQMAYSETLQLLSDRPLPIAISQPPNIKDRICSTTYYTLLPKNQKSWRQETTLPTKSTPAGTTYFGKLKVTKTVSFLFGQAGLTEILPDQKKADRIAHTGSHTGEHTRKRMGTTDGRHKWRSTRSLK